MRDVGHASGGLSASDGSRVVGCGVEGARPGHDAIAEIDALYTEVMARASSVKKLRAAE